MIAKNPRRRMGEPRVYRRGIHVYLPLELIARIQDAAAKANQSTSLWAQQQLAAAVDDAELGILHERALAKKLFFSEVGKGNDVV